MLHRICMRLPTFTVGLAVLATLVLGQPARATLEVTLITSHGTDSSGTDSTNTAQGFNLNTGSGLSFVSATGVAYGTNTPGTAPTGGAGMFLDALSFKTVGSGTATLIFSQNGLTSPIGTGLMTESLKLESESGVTGSATASYQTFGDSANTLYTTVPVTGGTVAGTGVATFTSTSASGSFTSASPYSLTEVLQISFSGAFLLTVSTDSLTQFTVSVPEPTSIALALAGLPVLGLLWRRQSQCDEIAP